MSQPPERVVAYIDGFNLYYGLKDKGWRRFLWLDLNGLAKSLLLPHQKLLATKYFTARVSKPAPSERRQSTFIDALDAVGGVQRFEGKFQPKQITCRSCHHVHQTYEEKQTDVNVAVEMVRDAHLDGFDTALLISADSDLTPPVTAAIAAGKRVIVACPPARFSDVLTKAATGSIPIYKRHLRANQLPDSVTTLAGVVLTRPATWV